MNNSLIPFFPQKDMFIEKAKDCYLIDANGNKYFDMDSGDWAANIGHSRDEIISVIKDQAEKAIHDGLHCRNKQSEELSKKLLEKTGLTNGSSTFLNSGSEAVNLGITIARNLTKRKKVLKLDCSYISSFGFGRNTTDNPDLINIPIDDFTSIEKLNFKDIAVFVLEAGNSGSLIKFPSNEFIENIANVAKQDGCYLMANEVTVGFGRTGKWFGFQHYNYTPDIIAVGKALGNGYPISGVIISQETTRRFKENPFRHAQSHQNDPLGCAVALEVIRIMDEEGLVERSKETGNYFMKKLIRLQSDHPNIILDVRGRGLMIGLEFDPKIDFVQITKQLLKNGMLVGHKEKVLRFMPPLIIGKDEIDRLIVILGDSL